MTTKQAFLEELNQVFKEAQVAGSDRVTITAGDLHRRVGGYPGPDHRMAVASRLMWDVLAERHGDKVLAKPPKGLGASLEIEYVLPRPGRAPAEGARPPGGAVQPPPVSAPPPPHVHPVFLAAVEALHASFEKLSHMPPVKPPALKPGAKISGVYLFSEGARPMYVGRTRNLQQRIGNHCGSGATESQAVFAFKLAREATKKGRATYTTEGSRKSLLKDPAFAAAFKAAKERVREMDLRFVEEPDPLKQTLLELYVAVALKTDYNDFETH